MSKLKGIYEGENVEKWYFGYLFQGAAVLGSLPILLPIVVSHFANDGVAGVVVAMFYAGQLVAPLWGRLAEGTGNFKRFFLMGFVLILLGAFFFGFTKNEAFWILLALVQGIGAGASNTVSAMLIVDFKPKEQWNKRIGWLQTFYGVGQAIGLALAAALSVSPVNGVIISGLLMIPGYILGRRELPVEKHKHAPKQGTHLKGISIVHSHSFSFVSHFHIPNGKSIAKFSKEWKTEFNVFILMWLLINISRGLVYALFPLMMMHLFGIHPGVATLYYAISAVICVFLYEVSGKAGNSFGNKKVVVSGISMTFLSCILMLILSYLDYHFVNYFLGPICFMVLPISWAPLIVSATSLTSELATMNKGSALGIFNSAYAIGVVVSAFIAGGVAVSLGYRAILLLAAVSAFFSIMMYRKMNRLKNEKHKTVIKT